MWCKTFSFVFLAAVAVSACGCKQTLETGYEPLPLTATPDMRRAYYAPAFSPESRVTDRSQTQQSPIRPGRPAGY